MTPDDKPSVLSELWRLLGELAGLGADAAAAKRKALQVMLSQYQNDHETIQRKPQ